MVKNPPANAGGMGSIPDLRRSHMPRSIGTYAKNNKKEEWKPNDSKGYACLSIAASAGLDTYKQALDEYLSSEWWTGFSSDLCEAFPFPVLDALDHVLLTDSHFPFCLPCCLLPFPVMKQLKGVFCKLHIRDSNWNTCQWTLCWFHFLLVLLYSISHQT